MAEIFKKNYSLLKGFFGLFAFLFLLHTAPYSYSISHTFVHKQGIIHSHDDAGPEHTQEDHASGKVKDCFFKIVFTTQQNAFQNFFKTHFKYFIKILVYQADVFFQRQAPMFLFCVSEVYHPPSPVSINPSHPHTAPPSSQS